VADPALLATDLADYLVEHGVAFREAHHAVGALVKCAEGLGVSLPQVPAAEAAKIHAQLGADWPKVFELGRAMKARKGTGMPSPDNVKRQIARWRKILAAG
jgi:argininosuccinate lyase